MPYTFTAVGAMFDELTVEQLDELSWMLNDADHELKTRFAYECCYKLMRLEISALEYDVWEARCRLSGKRCLRCAPTPAEVAAAA